MNYKFWLLFVYFTLSLTSVFSQGYKLTAKFSNYKPQKVTLGYYYEENRYVVIDSAQQSGSTVIFEGEKPLPAGIYCVILTANNEYFDLLIDKDNQNFSMKCDVADIQKTMKITGSEVNSKFFDYQRSMTELMKQQSKIDTLKKYSTDSSEIEKYDVRLSEIDSKYSKLLLDAVEANKGNILSDMLDCMNAYTFPGNEMLNHINFSQPGLLRTPFFFQRIRAHIARHIEEGQYEIMRQNDLIIKKAKANPDVYYYVTGYLLNFYRTFYKLGMNEVFVHIADKYFLPDTVQNLSAENRKMIKDQRDIYYSSIPGADARNIKVCNMKTDDSLQVLDHIKDKLFLLFWANGCGHCDSAENAIKYYYDRLLANGISVISVCNDNHRVEELKRNSEKKNFPWIDCHDTKNNSRYREYYYVVSTPVMYIINKDGVIENKVVGEDRITDACKMFSN